MSEVTVENLIRSLRVLTPDARFAMTVERCRPDRPYGIAIYGPDGWEMFAASYTNGDWLWGFDPSIQQMEWIEIPQEAEEKGEKL